MNENKLEFPRRKTRQVRIGHVPVGGGAPVAVQSMIKTGTGNVKAVLQQLKRLEAAGCEIVRLAVPDQESAAAFTEIKKNTAIPLVADIHFDHRLALAAVSAGADGLRINPGNIGSRRKVREVAAAAGDRGIPIRIGVNAGSLEKDLLQKHRHAGPEAMVESALRHIRILEEMNFDMIKVSLKASDIHRTLAASRRLAEEVPHPFHAGITEAGGVLPGTAKSSAGLTLLLREGLADTIRVSLTADPVDEVRAAYFILSALGIRQHGPVIISCPVCGRCEVNLPAVAEEVEKRLIPVKKTITVAVMGCMVNGPGEAREADIGVACGRGNGVIFSKGRIVRKVKEEAIVDELMEEVSKFA
ncbi:MAG: flavodoxin-dependent (E)-4-hydroxy-3-methylbut-2-enyl-diphosphate synthase [Candidatus Aminicenantes bacterium]